MEDEHNKTFRESDLEDANLSSISDIDFGILHSKLRMLMKGEEGPCMEENQEKTGLTDDEEEEEEEESDDEQLPDI